MSSGIKTTSTSIHVRFGDAVLQDGHTAIPNLVLKHYAELGITPTEMMFIIHVWQFWWTERQPFPSLNTVSRRMNISRRQARNYTQSLREKRFLEVHDRFSQTLGQMSSEYDFSPLLRAIVLCAEGHETEESSLIPPPRKNPSEGGRKNLSGAPRKDSSPKEDIDMKKTNPEKDLHNSNIRKIESGGKRQGRAGADAQASPGPEGVGAILGRMVQGHAGAVPRSAGNGASGRPEAGSEDFQRIQHIILTSQREFGDRASAKSSTTRAWNLYQKAGYTIGRFEEALYQARSLTKEATAQITSEGEDPNYGLRRKIKMPYFFAVLEDVLGLRPAPQKPAPAAKVPRTAKGSSDRRYLPHIET